MLLIMPFSVKTVPDLFWHIVLELLPLLLLPLIRFLLLLGLIIVGPLLIWRLP